MAHSLLRDRILLCENANGLALWANGVNPKVTSEVFRHYVLNTRSLWAQYSLTMQIQVAAQFMTDAMNAASEAAMGQTPYGDSVALVIKSVTCKATDLAELESKQIFDGENPTLIASLFNLAKKMEAILAENVTLQLGHVDPDEEESAEMIEFKKTVAAAWLHVVARVLCIAPSFACCFQVAM